MGSQLKTVVYQFSGNMRDNEFFLSKRESKARKGMLEDNFLEAAERAIYEAITKQLANEYRGPIKDCVDTVLSKHQQKLESIVEGAYLRLIESESFQKQVDDALTNKLARSLVSKMGGEIESKVNELKANPETRAQITLAISKLVKTL